MVFTVSIGDDDIARIKGELGFDPEAKFAIDADVYKFYRDASAVGETAYEKWQTMWKGYGTSYPNGQRVGKTLEWRIA